MNNYSIKNLIRKNLEDRLKDKYKNTVFYLPEYINYALPTSEKQFVGNYPVGTIIDFQDACTIGIHWFNTKVNGKEDRVDLDLHWVDRDNENIGWNSNFENDEIIFSGDMTDAPRPYGATEALVFSNTEDMCGAIEVENFNDLDGKGYSYDLFFSKQKFEKYQQNQIFSQDELIIPIIKITDCFGTLGYVRDGKFIFAKGSFGSNVPTAISKSIQDDYVRQLTNKVLITDVGLYITRNKAAFELMASKFDNAIDLSPENITKNTFMDLLN